MRCLGGNSQFSFLELSASQDMVDAAGKVDRSGLKRFGYHGKKFTSPHKGAALKVTGTATQGTGLNGARQGLVKWGAQFRRLQLRDFEGVSQDVTLKVKERVKFQSWKLIGCDCWGRRRSLMTEIWCLDDRVDGGIIYGHWKEKRREDQGRGREVHIGIRVEFEASIR